MHAIVGCFIATMDTVMGKGKECDTTQPKPQERKTCFLPDLKTRGLRRSRQMKRGLLAQIYPVDV